MGRNILLLLGTICLGQMSYAPSAVADSSYASKERTTISRAHMSRARALLVEALAEFEEGRKYARPDLLVDSEDWRLRVVSLTEQLNRVIDPKPRVTREGAVFRAPPRFVKREKDHLPPVEGAAKPRSDYGEKQRMKEKQEARAKLYEEKSAKVAENHKKQTKNQVLSIEELLEEEAEFEEDLAPASKSSGLSEGKSTKDNSKENKQSASAGTKETVKKDKGFSYDENYDEKLQAPPRKGDVTYFEDEDVDDSSVARLLEEGEDELGELPKVISDKDLEKISPEVVDSRLIEDEELTKRLERTLSER